LAEVAKVLADERISIASMNQPAPGDEGEAELIFLLHRADEEALTRAWHQLGSLSCVRRLCTLIRLLD
jgi:(p)ppGpp synthase/HD superfamily hydrolase